MDYNYTDKMVTALTRQLVRRFSRLKSVLDLDELNIVEEVNALYAEISALVRRVFLQIAVRAYRDSIRLVEYRDLDAQWVEELLSAYDPVSKYVFNNEEDRRRARLIEAIIASPTKEQEVDSALRSLSYMYRTYAVRITDEAVLQAYRDNLEDDEDAAVRWVAELDNRTCSVCWKRDGKIFPIAQLPPKPHLNCRCTFDEVD